MPRKTREQKIITDLRRQLQSARPAPLKTVVKELPRIETSLPKLNTAAVPSVSIDYSYLGRDLLKVGALVALLTALEIVISLFISSGGLKSFGLN